MSDIREQPVATCRKPKSNENGKYKRVIERERIWRLGFSSGSAM